MLVIRRRSGESLLVGDNVEIEILEVSGGQVKLGIRAPRDVLHPAAERTARSRHR